MHVQIEAARREKALLMEQERVADYGINLLNQAIGSVSDTADPTPADLLTLAMAKVRLAELKVSHGNLVKRVEELTKALQAADSGILRPGGVLPR